MIVSAHQPQYLPWLGYFDKIAQADVFVLLDTVQYKKNEWQNRNRIKTATGPQWLTVPVSHRHDQPIREVAITGGDRWQHRHGQSLVSNYRRAPHWAWMQDFVAPVLDREWASLSELNIHVVCELAALLGIRTPIVVASDLGPTPDHPDDRLVAITRRLGGDRYLAGAGGHDYMDLSRYERAGVEVVFQSYAHPGYDQLFGAFTSHLSVVDLLFNHGEDSLSILRGRP